MEHLRSLKLSRPPNVTPRKFKPLPRPPYTLSRSRRGRVPQPTVVITATVVEGNTCPPAADSRTLHATTVRRRDTYNERVAQKRGSKEQRSLAMVDREECIK